MFTSFYNWFLARSLAIKVLLLTLGYALISVKSAIDDRVILQFTWGQVLLNRATFGWYRTFVLANAYPEAHKAMVRNIVVQEGLDSTEAFNRVEVRVTNLEARVSELPAKIVEEFKAMKKADGTSLFQIDETVSAEPAAVAA